MKTKRIFLAVSAALVILVLGGCGGSDTSAPPLFTCIMLVALATIAQGIGLGCSNKSVKRVCDGVSITALVTVVVFALAGCGGGGTPPIGGGGGGGGDERLSASYIGTANTEYGCFYGQPSRLDLAQSFVGDGRWVSRASFTVYRTGAGVGTYVIDVQADAGGLPSGVALGTSNPVPTASLSPTAAWQDFVFASPVRCTTGGTYWLVLRKVGGANIVGAGLIAKANTNPESYPPGRIVSKGETWQEIGNDALFRVYTKL
ncbi:MAG: hypothetical protein AAB669_03985 [Patescibacteria group bacterium]